MHVSYVHIYITYTQVITMKQNSPMLPFGEQLVDCYY